MSADQKNRNKTTTEQAAELADLAKNVLGQVEKLIADNRALAARVAILEKRMQSLTPRALPGVPPAPPPPAPSGPPNDANTDNSRPPPPVAA